MSVFQFCSYYQTVAKQGVAWPKEYRYVLPPTVRAESCVTAGDTAVLHLFLGGHILLQRLSVLATHTHSLTFWELHPPAPPRHDWRCLACCDTQGSCLGESELLNHHSTIQVPNASTVQINPRWLPVFSGLELWPCEKRQNTPASNSLPLIEAGHPGLVDNGKGSDSQVEP